MPIFGDKKMSDIPKSYVRFPLAAELREKTIQLLDKLEQSQDPTQYRGAFGDLIVELTNDGLDYFFIKPLELAKVGFVKQQSANIGMAGAKSVMRPMVRQIIGGMDKNQLLIICSHIRQLMN